MIFGHFRLQYLSGITVSVRNPKFIGNSLIFKQKSTEGGAQKKYFRAKIRKSLLAFSQIGRTMYGNTKINPIRAFGADIIGLDRADIF